MPKRTVSVVGTLAVITGVMSAHLVGNMPGADSALGSPTQATRDVPVALKQGFAVSIKNLQFNPNSLDMAVGDTVTWTNNETDGTAHNINSDDGTTFRAPADLKPGDTFSFTPTAPGSFPYHCNIHPQTTGVLNVGGSGSAPPPPPPNQPPPPPPSNPSPPPSNPEPPPSNPGLLPGLPALPALPGLPGLGAAPASVATASSHPFASFDDLFSQIARLFAAMSLAR